MRRKRDAVERSFFRGLFWAIAIEGAVIAVIWFLWKLQDSLRLSCGGGNGNGGVVTVILGPGTDSEMISRIGVVQLHGWGPNF